MTNFSAVELIIRKRDGLTLTTEEIDWFISAYLSGVVAEEQMSAMAMAILLNGMGKAEIADWTQAYIRSGTTMDWSGIGRPTADKHSTGGVGDKISLPLVCVAAACGLAVPQLSGRGLGHTGGTLDKLESIPGWRATLTTAEMAAVLRETGAVVCAANAELAPADRRIYALRDVTGTVESIPLIAASIMSKKIAEGTGALVLDVKVGSGAFMKTVNQARELAQTMVEIGMTAGVSTRALLTAMDTPLGNSAGNALEVAESLEVLAGGGPADVVELTIALANEMFIAAGIEPTKDPGTALSDGSAMDIWRKMITAQGGQVDAPLPRAKHVEVVRAERDGYLTKLDALAVGIAAWRLGAGRARKEDAVQAGAGVIWHTKLGEPVVAGQTLFTLHTDDENRITNAIESLNTGYEIGTAEEIAPSLPLIIDRVNSPQGQ
ncbi:MAG: thymidine phosphorylase [Actinomycetales bacterium]|nr:thymidine phosphorylase [Actinomycetales bacterium]